MRFFKTTAAKITLLLFFAGIAVAGVLMDDVREVMMNASILCFSCIGLK
jgi:hypothetical protein